MNKYKYCIALILALWTLPSFACHRITPHRAPVDSYEAVFLGRVTGIHLVGYENSLTGDPDAYIDGEAVNIIDGSASVLVKTVPIKLHHGKVGKSIELKLVGCTAPLPKLKERGLFFINPKSNSAVTVWESDTEAFSYWLKRLGLPDSEA